MPTPDDFAGLLHAALRSEPQRLSRQTVPFRAAVAAILRPADPGPELLFIHRAEHPLDPWSGHMAFPGGRMNPADPHAQAAAERETEEEINVRLAESATLLGRLDEIQARASQGRLPLGISPFVYWLHAPVEPCLSREVQQVVWIPLLELFAPRNRRTLDYSMDGQVLTLPSIVYREKVVWGLTLRILGDLLGRLATSPVEPWVREALGLGSDEALLPEYPLLLR